MPLVRISVCLRGELDMSRAQSIGRRPADSFARLAAVLRHAAPANADIGFGLLLLFTWQVTSIPTRPQHLMLSGILTLLLLICARSALGKSIWLCRVGRDFWFYSFAAGMVAAIGVWVIAGMFHQSLGAVPPPSKVLLASSSGAVLEELLFRGLLFWLLFGLTNRSRVFHDHASAATVLAIAVAFALSHTGRTGLSLFTTMLTGTAYGWMRVQSGSTATVALMHGVYNQAISCIAAL
jgi:membrane protease YdiL (CAAX protease family)